MFDDGVDMLVFGCMYYLFFIEMICDFVGECLMIVDMSDVIVCQFVWVFDECGLCVLVGMYVVLLCFCLISDGLQLCVFVLMLFGFDVLVEFVIIFLLNVCVCVIV